MLLLVRDGPRSVNEIAEHFDITQQAVSQHLHVLKDAGLVAVRAEAAAGSTWCARRASSRSRRSSPSCGPPACSASRTPSSPAMAAEPLTASVHIEATPERVFEYFTSPEAMVRWMGDYALLEPAPGRRLRRRHQRRRRSAGATSRSSRPTACSSAGATRAPSACPRARARSRCASARWRRDAGGDRPPRPPRRPGRAASRAAGRTSPSASRSRPPAAIRAPIRGRPRRGCGSSTTAQSPSMSSSPGTTRERLTRRPSSHVPLQEPRSTASQAPSTARSSR